MKREQGKAAFAFLPSRLTSRRYLSCGTGEAPSLGGAASSQGDFLGFIDSTCCSAFPLAKVMFALTELDHLMKNLCKVFEVFSFLNWTVGNTLLWTTFIRFPSPQSRRYYPQTSRKIRCRTFWRSLLSPLKSLCSDHTADLRSKSAFFHDE